MLHSLRGNTLVELSDWYIENLEAREKILAHLDKFKVEKKEGEAHFNSAEEAEALARINESDRRERSHLKKKEYECDRNMYFIAKELRRRLEVGMSYDHKGYTFSCVDTGVYGSALQFPFIEIKVEKLNNG